MIRILTTLIAAVLFAGALPARAALVTLDIPYKVNFIDPSVASAIGPFTYNGTIFSMTATYESTLLGVGAGPNQVIIPSDGSAGSFLLNFGTYSFTQANDLFGGPLLTLGPSNEFNFLNFDTDLTIPSGIGAGTYLLSFSGNSFQLTPEGNTTDFKAEGMAVPLPAALPLFMAGLGLLGFAGKRRSRKAGVQAA